MIQNVDVVCYVAQLASSVQDVFPAMAPLFYPTPVPWIHPLGH